MESQRPQQWWKDNGDGLEVARHHRKALGEVGHWHDSMQNVGSLEWGYMILEPKDDDRHSVEEYEK